MLLIPLRACLELGTHLRSIVSIAYLVNVFRGGLKNNEHCDDYIRTTGVVVLIESQFVVLRPLLNRVWGETVDKKETCFAADGRV